MGICLKRYAMTESGEATRRNTYIDIPDSLRLPQFMLAGGPQLDQDPTGLSAEYKLVLQSVVCHRGESLQSGHYIAFARVAPKLLTGNRRHDFDPPPDYEEAQWVKFDDLEDENRVIYVDNIKEALRQEMPYLLFYQIVPMCEMPRTSTDGTEAGPPSYNDSFSGSKTSFELTGTSFSNEGSIASTRLTSNYREDLQAAEKAGRSKPPSIRLSCELDAMETPQRANSDRAWAMSHTGSTPGGSRRESVALTESPAITPAASSPVIGPADDSTASRLSRAASRFALGKQSRPPSQSGEGRLSFSMTRLGGLMKSSKESAADSNGLNPPSSNLTGPPGSEVSQKAPPDAPVDGEKHGPAPQSGGQRSKPKYDKRKDKEKGKSKDKDKEKAEKPKSDEQPERECSVM